MNHNLPTPCATPAAGLARRHRPLCAVHLRLGLWERAALAAILVWLVCAGGAAVAAEWKVIAPQRVNFSNLSSVLRNGAFADATEKKTFFDYFAKAEFPKWTYPGVRTPWHDGALDRKDLLRTFRMNLAMAERAQAHEVYAALCEVTIETLGGYAADAAFSPETRYNAMLAIGELKDPAAVAEMVKALQDKNQLDAVRVAALIGLNQRASLIDANTQAALVPRLTAIVGFKIPDGPRADAMIWMRGQAAELLGNIGSTGAGNAVPDKLCAMLDDEGLPLSKRAVAAVSLGKLNYANGAPPAGPCLKSLGGFVIAVLTADAAMEGKEPLIRRRQLKGMMQCAGAGLTGVATFAKAGPEQDFAAKAQAAIKELSDKLDDDRNSAADTIAALVDKTAAAISGALKALK